MNSLKVPQRVDLFLTKKLSGTVFSWQEIWNLMVPGVLDSLSIMFINMLITALISSNGESSVAAVSLVGPITGMIVYVFSGISSGGTVVVAQCCGKRDEKMKKCSIGITIWVTVLIGLIVCIPMLIFPRQLLLLLYPHAEAEVMNKASIFLSGCVWSIIVFTLYTAIFAVLRGLGESRKCLILSIIINVAYLLFSILFLNVLNLDIYGSVYALFLARLIGMLAAVVALFYWHPPVRMKIKEIFAFDRSLLRSTLKIGIPMSFEQMFISLSGIVSGMYMVALGTTAIATNAITNSLLGLLYAPSMSVGGLSVAVVGRCVGACKTDEAVQYGKRCNQIALALLVLFSLVFYPLLPLLLRQYNPSAEAYSMVTKILYASIPALFIFWPASYIMPSTLRAVSDAVYPTVVTLTVLWVITIALGYVLAIPAGLGLWGVWIATWTSWIVRATCFQLRFRLKKWGSDASLVG